MCENLFAKSLYVQKMKKMKMVLEVFDLRKNAQNEMQSFLWRSFCLEIFSGERGEFWAKKLLHPKNLPAPILMLAILEFCRF